jgi:hypothetical protein
MAMLVAQQQGRGNQESAVLACANHDRCHGPLWDFLGDVRRPERRQQLTSVLL